MGSLQLISLDLDLCNVPMQGCFFFEIVLIYVGLITQVLSCIILLIAHHIEWRLQMPIYFLKWCQRNEILTNFILENFG